MRRVYIVRDARGERRLEAGELPLSVGGGEEHGIALPGPAGPETVAHIGLSEGHAFVQPADAGGTLFHNHEHLTASKWLKSGDLIEIGASLIRWQVRGDQVFISVEERPAPETLAPPATPPPPNNRPLPEATRPPAKGRAEGPLRWLALGLFLVLLLAGAFVLLATPVAVHITPEPESQSLEGFPPAVAFGGRLLALPGHYRVTARRSGYRPLERTIEILGDGFQRFDLRLEELPGRVGIELQPDVPFRLYIDDAAVIPDSEGFVELAGGNYRLRVETARYLPVERPLTVSGRGDVQRLELALRPAWAEVRIESEPAGARLEIDGRQVGETPLTTELLQGEHTLLLRLAGYKPLSLSRQVRAGSRAVFDGLRLQPADGRMVLASEPTGASVSVDGVFQGATPVTLTLSSTTEHRLRLTKPGYLPYEKTLRLVPEEERSLDALLRPELGIVFVTARPADASLRVDGREAGPATQRLQLTTRPHTLEFSKPGYASERLTVTPRAGSSQNVDITLRTAVEAAAARKTASALVRSADGQQLRLVRPRGSFRMGSSRREAGRRANESPRRVQLTRSFYLGSREVTNAQYRQFRAAHNSGRAEGVSLNTDDQPVVNVSWEEAARFCNWLSGREGLPPAYEEIEGRMRPVAPMTTGYRLPSEAEWAYVARKLGRESEDVYPWSGVYPPTVVAGNFADASIADTLANTVPDYNDGRRVAAPVGSFPSRPDGFHDLGGNVAEWMHDRYAVYPGKADALTVDPLGPDSGEHHVVRGSSWRHGTIATLRLSYRDYSRSARPDLGFRIARYAE